MKQAVRYILISAGITAILIGSYFGYKYIFTKSSKLSSGSNILFVGDSITAGVNFSYSYLIQKKLSDINVDVLALGGMQTSWMLQNLPAQLAKKKYDRVYIWGGVNDAFSGVTAEKAVANVQAMVDLVNKQGGQAYVIVGYDAQKFMADSKLKPTAYVPTQAGMIALKNKYIAYQSLLKRSVKNAVVVDQFDIDSSHTSDGIHPDGIAQQNIANTLLQNIV